MTAEGFMTITIRASTYNWANEKRAKGESFADFFHALVEELKKAEAQIAAEKA